MPKKEMLAPKNTWPQISNFRNTKETWLIGLCAMCCLLSKPKVSMTSLCSTAAPNCRGQSKGKYRKQERSILLVLVGHMISTQVSSISTGLWKCITHFDQAVSLLHFSHNMATISSNIKTSRLPHVFAIYLFLSPCTYLPKMFLQAWNYASFIIPIYKKLKKNLAFIFP